MSGGLLGAVADGNSAGPSISSSGRFVAFASDASNLVPDDGNGTFDVFVRDLKKRTTSRASVAFSGAEAHGLSDSPAIAGNGRGVTFVSDATDLVTGDENGRADVFVRILGGK